MLCAAACVWLRAGGSAPGGPLRLAERWQLEQLLGGADGGGSRARHAEHARLGLETAFREDARALRARLHPFGRSRLELGYRGSGTR